MTQQARVRRLQDTLVIVGSGVVAFGAWTLVKTTMFFFLLDEETQRQLFQVGLDIPMQTFYVAFAFASFVDMMVRMFVGLSARAEGRGKRKGLAYLVVAALMVVSSVLSIVFVMAGSPESPSLLDLLMSVVIEATSVAMLVLMIVCAVRLRRLGKSVE